MEETKVIYYVDEEETPYMLKINSSPGKVTLADFKGQLNRSYHKFFFKSVDDDVGVVKEEITEDEASLPNTNGRVVCWVVTGESSASGSDVGGSKGDLESVRGKEEDETSIVSGNSRASSHRHRPRSHRHHHSSSRHRHHRPRHHHPGSSQLGSTSEISATDFESTSGCDTEDTLSRISATTASTLTSLRGPRKKVLTKHRPPRIPRSMSCSTMTTTSNMTDASLQIVKVTLNMETVNFLGISIVGQTNEDGVGGIYVGSIMKGGAVAQDGRIEPGDMLLEVNSISFENMSNDDAVRALREIVQQPGPITLTVAKCWDPEPIIPPFEPRLEPIRPIDPSAWVMQTNHHQAYGDYGRPFTGSPTLSTMTSNSSPSLDSSIPESERDLVKLTLTTPMYRIAKALSSSNSGLQVKDRVWLKMTIPRSFIGSDLVDWLHTNVEGFIDRRHARKYAALMLKHGFVRHTVNKITFSEQCYYVFGDFKTAASSLPAGFTNLQLSDSGDGDTLGPLPGHGNLWGSSDGEISAHYDYGYHGRPGPLSASSKSNSPSPENKVVPLYSSSHGSSGSSSASANTQQQPPSLPPNHPPPENTNANNGANGIVHPHRMRHSSSLSSYSGFTSVSQQQHRPIFPPLPPDRMSIHSGRSGGLGVAAHLAHSRESFQQALDNPCNEYFIDVM